MHTYLCGHAYGAPIEYVMRAAEVGIEVVTFTCHVPMVDEGFGQSGIRMRRDELGRYRSLVEKVAAQGKQYGVEVLYGIEAEIFPSEEALSEMDGILRAEPFDFVLGSLHAHTDSYGKWLRKNGAKKDAQRIDSYFRHLKDGVQSGRYDSIAHPDVIRTYGVVRSFDPLAHEEVIVDFLDALVEEDLCMEVNTSGLNKGAYEVHPDPIILEWAAARGVRLTIGSDSHLPDSVGQHFDSILPLLKSKGFETIHYFRGRKRVEVPILI